MFGNTAFLTSRVECLCMFGNTAFLTSRVEMSVYVW